MKVKIADTLRALKIREQKSWKAIDWALSDSNADANIKLKAAEFILKRLYPEKTIISGAGENGEFKVTIEIADENNITPESRNRISQYLTV